MDIGGIWWQYLLVGGLRAPKIIAFTWSLKPRYVVCKIYWCGLRASFSKDAVLEGNLSFRACTLTVSSYPFPISRLRSRQQSQSVAVIRPPLKFEDVPPPDSPDF